MGFQQREIINRLKIYSKTNYDEEEEIQAGITYAIFGLRESI
jgi:hypothetical protein